MQSHVGKKWHAEQAAVYAHTARGREQNQPSQVFAIKEDGEGRRASERASNLGRGTLWLSMKQNAREAPWARRSRGHLSRPASAREAVRRKPRAPTDSFTASSQLTSCPLLPRHAHARTHGGKG
eukprot:451430-Pleurochrysis_carterae.AAC.1